MPGEGFCVPGVVSPLVLRERYQGKACLCLCSLSPGVESWVAWGSLIVFLCFCCCVVCLAVKQGEPPEKAMPPLPILPHHLFLTVSNPSPLIFTISVMVCLLFYINSFTSLAPNLLSLRSYSLIILIYTLSSLTVSHKPILAGCVCK